MSETLTCPNCGEPVEDDNPGCVLHALIQCVRERDTDLTEEDLQKLHARTDVSRLWDVLGEVIDDLEEGRYSYGKHPYSNWPVFEVIGAGFTAEMDETDERVLWVAAFDRWQLEKLIEGTGARLGNELGYVSADDPDVDFVMTGEDDTALIDRLLMFASDTLEMEDK